MISVVTAAPTNPHLGIAMIFKTVFITAPMHVKYLEYLFFPSAIIQVPLAVPIIEKLVAQINTDKAGAAE